MKFCPGCGQKLVIEEREPVQEKAGDVRAGTTTIDQGDPTYYSDGKGVRITATRLIIGSKTYAMANIVSVSSEAVPAKRTRGYIMAFIGLAILIIWAAFNGSLHNPFWNRYGLPAAAVLLVTGIIAGATARQTYCLKLTSAAGEETPIASTDSEYISQVAVAVNDALIRRG